MQPYRRHRSDHESWERRSVHLRRIDLERITALQERLGQPSLSAVVRHALERLDADLRDRVSKMPIAVPHR